MVRATWSTEEHLARVEQVIENLTVVVLDTDAHCGSGTHSLIGSEK